MSAKRALVVDDSKSARAFLSRLLEKHNLDVDTAESAEDAIEYLNRHRPDVIFMDHLMPGMDGFQAVQAIKNNPRTATIPILMYTSQEGELYLGQARALGAVGVLPKQIKPADVSTVLHQLHLAEDRRDASRTAHYDGEERRTGQGVLAPLSDAEVPPAVPGEDTSEVEILTQAAAGAATASRPMPPSPIDVAALREEVGELRHLVVTGIDGQTERLLGEIRKIAADAQRAADTSPATRDWRGSLFAFVATAAAILLAVLWLRGEVERRSLEMQVAQLSSTHTALVAEPAGASPAESTAASTNAVGPVADDARRAALPTSPAVFLVPYGEPPLGGQRVERLRTLLTQLADSGFQGSVEVQAFPGRYCLAGNANDGYSLAADATPTSQCELIGTPGEEAAQRESLPFANMVAEFRKAHGADITLTFTTGSADQMQRFYPDAGARTVAAGEWNAAAGLNNRIEVRWRPRP